jgi:hypothetical protein
MLPHAGRRPSRSAPMGWSDADAAPSPCGPRAEIDITERTSFVLPPWTSCARPLASDRGPTRSCIRERQQRRADCSYPRQGAAANATDADPDRARSQARAACASALAAPERGCMIARSRAHAVGSSFRAAAKGAVRQRIRPASATTRALLVRAPPIDTERSAGITRYGQPRPSAPRLSAGAPVPRQARGPGTDGTPRVCRPLREQ